MAVGAIMILCGGDEAGRGAVVGPLVIRLVMMVLLPSSTAAGLYCGTHFWAGQVVIMFGHWWWMAVVMYTRGGIVMLHGALL